jgi:acyl-CoA dehydrogenase
MTQLRRSASHLPSAIGAVASMECAISLTTGRRKLRGAFGQPIIEFQNAAFKLAERKAEAMIARVLVAGELDTVTASMAEWVFAETGGDRGRILAASGRLRLHAGMSDFAYVRGCARIWKIGGGANGIMKLLIARSL